MEMIYRGYPQVFDTELLAQDTKYGKFQEIEPYRVYDRERQQQFPAEWDARRRINAEYDYIRGLYPMNVRNWQRFVEEEFDREDRPGSQIYDEYPDREWLHRMHHRIMAGAGDQGMATNDDMVMVLALHEMLKRRTMQRH